MNFYIKVIPINEGKNALTQKLSVFLNWCRYYENLATAKIYEWKRIIHFIFLNNDIWILISDHSKYKSNLFIMKNSWAKTDPLLRLLSGCKHLGFLHSLRMKLKGCPRVGEHITGEESMPWGRRKRHGVGEHCKDHLQAPRFCEHRTYCVLSL